MSTPFSTNRDITGQPGGAPPIGFSGVAGNITLGRQSIRGGVPGPQSFANNESGEYITNGTDRVVYTLNVTLGVGNDKHQKINELETNVPTFVYTTPYATRYDSAGFVNARSLPMMNFYLRSEEGRRKYGNATCASAILADWVYWGVQQTDVTPQTYGWRQDAAITTFIGKRARVRNVWLALGERVDNGDRLWLLLRRHPYVSPLDAMFPESGIATDPNDVPMLQTARRLRMTEEEERKARQVPNHYWRIEPYISPNNEEPPAELTGGLGWSGTAWYIGLVTVIYNEQQQPKRHQRRAIESLFPSEHSAKWKEEIRKLPDVEIMLGVK